VAGIPEFAGRKLAFEPMSGGLTNRIYQVGADSTPVAVARVSSRKTSLLAIDREAEMRNAEAAAHAGVGPRVLAARPDIGISLVKWIDGRTFETHDLDDERQLERVAAQCRQLHAGPRFANEFDMFTVQRGYLAVVRERGFRLPDRYLDFIPQVEAIRAALAVQGGGTVPCHNDLLAANILDDGTRLWFIDYEYSGNNDPCFELGNIWSECRLSTDQLGELVTAYYGRRLRHKIARAHLQGIVAKYGWTLWGCIQSASSALEVDFWAWAMERYEAAVAEFNGPYFTRLLDDVSATD